MKTLLNSNLFPIINVGMYNSEISPEFIFDDYTIDEDFKNGDSPYNAEEFWEKFDNSLYVKEIQRRADEFLSGAIEANGIRIGIKTGEIYSPKCYNFGTDEIDLTVTFNKNKVRKFAKDNQEDFDKFLRKSYSSYDGFSSLTANNYEDWLVGFNEEDDREVGAVLTYIFKDELEEYREDFKASCQEEMYYSDFIKANQDEDR